MKKQKGITLIALVITIIVLLILAGITLTLVMGENGLIAKAQQAGVNYSEAENTENQDLAKLDNEVNSYISDSRENSKMDVLWSGYESTVGNKITLSQSVTNYDMIIINVAGSNRMPELASQTILTNDIKYTTLEDSNSGVFRYNIWGSVNPTYYYTVGYIFIDEITIALQQTQGKETGYTPGIYKITGIKL